MKAFVLEGRGKVSFIEKEEPKLLEEHGVLITPVLVSPCTSDVHTIWQGSPKRKNLTLGHECIGRILKKGREVKDFSEGEIVAISAITPDWGSPEVLENEAHAGHPFSAHSLGKSIDGAFQECFYLSYADQNLGKIPKGMDLEDALLSVDVLQTGFTAAEEAEVKEGDTVCVLGIGAIGLGAVFAAKIMGAKKIFAVGSREDSKRMAESLSSESCPVVVLDYKTCKTTLPKDKHPLANSTHSPIVNAIWEETEGKGVDKVLICGGDDYALAQALDMVKYGTGIVSNVAYFGSEEDVEALEMAGQDMELSLGEKKKWKKAIDGLLLPKFSLGKGMAGKTLRFSLSKGGRKHLEWVLEKVQESGFHPSIFLTKRYHGMDKIPDALYDMKERRAIKVAVYMEI